MANWVGMARGAAMNRNVPINAGGGQVVSESTMTVVVQLTSSRTNKPVLAVYDKTRAYWNFT